MRSLQEGIDNWSYSFSGCFLAREKLFLWRILNEGTLRNAGWSVTKKDIPASLLCANEMKRNFRKKSKSGLIKPSLCSSPNRSMFSLLSFQLTGPRYHSCSNQRKISSDGLLFTPTWSTSPKHVQVTIQENDLDAETLISIRDKDERELPCGALFRSRDYDEKLIDS